MENQGKILVFIVVIAFVGFIIYWFGIKKQAEEKAIVNAKKAEARRQYETDMLNWIKSQKGQANSWYENIRTNNGANKNAPDPTDSQILWVIQDAGPKSTSTYIYKGIQYTVGELYV